MQRLWLTGELTPAGARLTVQHVFRSAEKTALEVVYAFPLPRDAALRRFRLAGDSFEALSALRPTEEAVKAYEEGIAQGSLSTLARQYGDGIVNLTVGNLRPGETVAVYLEILAGVELTAEGLRFRFPFTLAPRYHAQCKAVASGPGEGEMEFPASEFGDALFPPYRKEPSALHQIGFECQIWHAGEVSGIGSPSHPLVVHGCRAALATAADVPDRDLVLDVHFAPEPRVLAGRLADGRVPFAAVLPPATFGETPEAPRRVAILLDRSGSMSGVPLEQARKAIDACLALLTETDTFGIVAFDDRIETLGDTLLTGSLENREHARKFLDRIDARGGTELADGVEAVCRLVGGGGDILILTDGQVAGAEAILARVRQTGSRLHCLGIGSASQDRFLTLLARETGGISHFVTPRERVDLSAVNLFASLGRPLAAGLTAEPEVEPAPPPAVFGGAPVLLFGEAGPEQRELNLRWDGGSRRLPIEPAGGTLGETLRLLRGARLITDWESRYPAEEALAPLERRKQNRIAMRLRALSEEYGLASREMSLVAVVKRAGDRPGELPDTRVVPVGFPQDMRFDDFFAGSFGGVQACFGAPPDFEPELARLALPRPLAAFSRRSSAPAGRPARSQAPSPDDALLALAARLQPDGGMPGATLDERAAATAVALLAFLAHGHTKDTGAFRSHVRRLASFLKALQGLSQERQEIVAAVLKANKTGHAPAGDWVRLAQSGRGLWPELEALVTA